METTRSTTLLAGLPEAWTPAFVRALSTPNQSIAELTQGHRHATENCRLISASPGWTGAAESLDRDEVDHSPVATAVIGALTAPSVPSLAEMLAALETAVVENDLGPQRLLATLIQRMMPRQSGRILLVTYDPRSITRPEDAAIRGSARGIFTYLESLRPALKRRGITAGMLLISPARREQWDMSASADAVASATAECLRKETLQRVIRVR